MLSKKTDAARRTARLSKRRRIVNSCLRFARRRRAALPVTIAVGSRCTTRTAAAWGSSGTAVRIGRCITAYRCAWWTATPPWHTGEKRPAIATVRVGLLSSEDILDWSQYCGHHAPADE